ncbi:MAG: RHS repeat-associated core domain-containing protein [Planctomycetota bacterium]
MYDPKVGRFLSEDPIGFEAGDANKSRYVENQPPAYTDPDGLTKKRAAQNRKNAAAWARQRAHDRARLYYLRALMIEFLEMARHLSQIDPPCEPLDKFPYADYDAIKGHIQYAIDKTNQGSVGIISGSSRNHPWIPGIGIGRESFENDLRGIMDLIHEWMHNAEREGVGLPYYDHDTEWFNGVSINDLIGPYSGYNNSFGRLYKFMLANQCSDGTSFWSKVRANAKVRAAEMIQEANEAAREAWERRLRARRGYGSGGRR